MVIIFEILDSIKVPAGTNSRRSSRGVSQQSQEEQMRRSMSLASQQEAPTRYQEEENPYNHQPSEMNGRRVSEANYPAQNRYDRSNNVRINNFQYFYICLEEVKRLQKSGGTYVGLFYLDVLSFFCINIWLTIESIECW